MTHRLFVYGCTTWIGYPLAFLGQRRAQAIQTSDRGNPKGSNEPLTSPQAKLTRFWRKKREKKTRKETLESVLRGSETAWQHGCVKSASPIKRRSVTSNARDKAPWGRQPSETRKRSAIKTRAFIHPTLGLHLDLRPLLAVFLRFRVNHK